MFLVGVPFITVARFGQYSNRARKGELTWIAIDPAGQYHPSFTVDDIDGYHERLTSRGVICVRPPWGEEYGRKLAKYVDPDGLPFTLSQPPSREQPQ